MTPARVLTLDTAHRRRSRAPDVAGGEVVDTLRALFERLQAIRALGHELTAACAARHAAEVEMVRIGKRLAELTDTSTLLPQSTAA